MWELRFLGHAFGIVDNDYYVSVRDGQVVSSLDTDENRAFLTWLHTLWEEGLLDHNGFSLSSNLRQITDENKDIPYGMMMAVTPLSVIPSKYQENYSILEPMTYEGKQVYRDLTGDVIRGTFAITSACKEPEKLVGWVNEFYTEEGSRMAQYRTTKLNSHSFSSALGLMDLIIDTIEQQHQPAANAGGKIKDFFRSLLGG